MIAQRQLTLEHARPAEVDLGNLAEGKIVFNVGRVRAVLERVERVEERLVRLAVVRDLEVEVEGGVLHAEAGETGAEEADRGAWKNKEYQTL